MHLVRSLWLAVSVSLVGSLTCLPLPAEPLIATDAVAQPGEPVAPLVVPIDLSDLPRDAMAAEDAAVVRGRAAAMGLTPSGEAVSPAPTPDAQAGTSVRSVIKESVRPMYKELAESGALETWHDVKETLGLGHQWSHQNQDEDALALQRARASANAAGWQDPAPAPKSAAQTQLDKDYDALLLRQLIDDLQPWLLGLIGLYALGYLTKAIFNLMQWKTARRRERRAQRARRRARRHAHRGGQDA